MPEGPSIVILREEVQLFYGKKIIGSSGNTKTAKDRLLNQEVIDFKSWGKHFLICFKDFYVRIHLLMFGSYRVNVEKENSSPRLSMKFKNDVLNFYTCSVKIVDGDVHDYYNWETDTMSEEWNLEKALATLKEKKERMVCDVLMNQIIFTGVGNIIKNEVLYRIKVHPESEIMALTLPKRKALVKEARNYCFDFYKWKKMFELKKNWLIYRAKSCPRCKAKVKLRATGEGQRRSFFCENCQHLYKKD
ncbi:MAG: endonuclease [Bacteroidota bacterium]|nr:endonuclease [Bacteroidota bacterium]